MAGGEGAPLGQRFLTDFRRFLGKDFWISGAMVIAATVVEGVGLLLLVPILAIATGNVSDPWLERAVDLLERAGVTGPDALLVAAVAAFLLVLLVRGALLRARDLRLAAHNLAFVDYLRMELVGAMASAPWQRVPPAERSRIEHTVHTDLRRIQAGTGGAMRASGNLSMMAAQLAVALVVSWKLTLVSLAVLAGLALALMPRVLAARRLGAEATGIGQRAHALLDRFLSGLKLAKAHGLERAFVARYAHSLDVLRARALDFARSQANAGMAMQVGAGAVLGAGLIAGFLWLELPVAVLGVFVVIFARLSRLAFAFVQAAQAYAYMIPAYGHFGQLLGELRAGDAKVRPDPDRGDTGAPAGALALSVRSLRHAPEPGAPPLFDGLSFEIAAGEMVALLGPSGAGKTTLLDLLTGVARGDAGSIALGGVEIAGGFPDALRARIAYVPQDWSFFDGDLRSNLEALSGACSDTEIAAALDVAGARDIPGVEGRALSLRVGEQGQRFSGGERQRLGIARALLRKPGLLILDEALSAVDPAREAAILARLAALPERPTIVLVTHRLPPDAPVDRVFRMEAGVLSVAPVQPRLPGAKPL